MAADARSRLRPASAAAPVERLVTDRLVLLPALAAVALMLLWAVHDGGYDADTWYWGALVMLAMLAGTLVVLGPRRTPISRPAIVALCAFGAYVAWSYLSMTWAEVPGWALEGSNRALLYLLVFALFLVLPWTARTARTVLVIYGVGVGVIALGMLLRLAFSAEISQLVIGGRLAAPTGYFNSSVALFMIEALLATVLAARRELPGLLRGFLVACACASLQLCVMGESRGWLFTLPLVLLCAITVVRDRLRVAAVAALTAVAAVVPVHQLIHVFQGGEESSAALTHAARGAAHTSLLICAAMMILGTLVAWAERLTGGPSLSRATRRRLGIAVTTTAVAFACAGAVVATHGHPIAFIKRQWNGFSHESSGASAGSHFAQVGSGRYDFWRVSLDALAAYPLGGLGQDNFADYYVSRRRTDEDPRWTHSLEMRLLAMTGLVGFVLFTTFIVGALAAALRARRRGTPLARAAAGLALLPLVVWLIHGSIDWFWELPALSGPALGFLGMACALGPATPSSGRRRSWRPPAWLVGAIGAVGLIACTVVLALPYLSIREISQASDISAGNPAAALADLATAADLDPWNPDPARLAGTIALQNGRFAEAQERFRQAIEREPDGWFAWLGAGLAASALGDRGGAATDFKTAAAINSQDSTIRAALARVFSRHPLTPGDALSMLASENA
jgi:hypothetical protein